MGPKKLGEQLKISLQEAKDLMAKYFRIFPKIKELMDRLTADAKRRRYALSPLDGRRRDLNNVDWDNPKQVSGAMNQSKNLPFQGCGASTTKLALCRLKHYIDTNNMDALIVNVIHDEILVEVHKDQAEQMAKVVEKEMIHGFNHFAPDVPMAVEAAISTHWLH